jgi:predicted dehydrogenase
MTTSSPHSDPGGRVLKVGVAGFGAVGAIRRAHVDAHPALQTVAVCDRRFPARGVDESGVRQWTRYEELLEEDLDALFVCLTNDIAPEVTAAGLERGLHVFCEKPPGRTVEDVVAVREVEARHPELRLKYGFNHRYHDSVREAKRIVDVGELGAVIDIKGTYGKSVMIRFDSDWRTRREVAGGGILLDQGIHMLDMMRLFGGEFTDIHAYVGNGYWRHDVEDNAYALMRTDEGVVAMLHSSATQWRHRFNLEITLAEGALELSGILSSTKSYGAETLRVVHRSDNHSGDPYEIVTRYPHDPSWEREVDDFARSALTGEPVRSGSSDDALRTMELVYAIYRADAGWAERWGLEPSARSAAP